MCVHIHIYFIYIIKIGADMSKETKGTHGWGSGENSEDRGYSENVSSVQYMFTVRCSLCEPDNREQNHKMLSSGHELAIALGNSWQLQLPVQGLYKSRPIIVYQRYERDSSGLASPWKISTVCGYLGLRSHCLQGVPTGECPWAHGYPSSSD